MRDAGDSLLYRETFTGSFSLGSTDPAEGAAAGELEGSQLTLIGSVEIDGVDRFIQDPSHKGSLTGRFDFAPIGRGLMATGGSFNLVRSHPRSRRASYECAFSHGGRTLCLIGSKELHDDPGFDAWSDLTTMFATLHEGLDGNGPIIGAGVLHQDRASIHAMLSNLNATNADSRAGRAASVTRFARFFAGELWDAYT